LLQLLSGKNAANALRRHYGLIDVMKNSFGIEMGLCENCQTLNPVTEQFCIKCHLPLTKEARMVNNVVMQALNNYFTQRQEDQAELIKTLLAPKSQN
jgi:predicted amidophosphoribosyltransferase